MLLRNACLRLMPTALFVPIKPILFLQNYSNFHIQFKQHLFALLTNLPFESHPTLTNFTLPLPTTISIPNIQHLFTTKLNQHDRLHRIVKLLFSAFNIKLRIYNLQSLRFIVIVFTTDAITIIVTTIFIYDYWHTIITFNGISQIITELYTHQVQ